jgi:CheY-like chemotaxis protein
MTYTILSIEDLSSFRQMIRLALEFEGFEVLDDQSGGSGLELARSLMPDLILLDVDLPDTEGPTVCKAIFADERLKHIPVVMLSSFNEDAQIEAA